MLSMPGTNCSYLLLLCTVLLLWAAEAHGDRNQAFINYKEGDTAQLQHEVLTHFVISTSFGDIKIQPRNDISPKIVQLVRKLAETKNCPSCKFYRHEPAPDNFGAAGFYGPPYALLQGSLADMAEMPPFEGSPVVARGDVCIIPNCKEFFIATAAHEEWGHAHSVWGKVADDASWATIARIPMEPFTTITDKSNITTRWLTAETHVPFKLSIE